MRWRKEEEEEEEEEEEDQEEEEEEQEEEQERLLLQLDLYCRPGLPVQVTLPTLSLLLYHCFRTSCWLLLQPPWLRSLSIMIITCSEEWGELSSCPFPQLLLHFLDQCCISVRIGRIHYHIVTFDRWRCLRPSLDRCVGF